MPHPNGRAPAQRTHPPQILLSIAAVLVVISIGTVATLAGARLLAIDRPATVGARPTRTATASAAATASPTATGTPASQHASPEPSATPPALGRRDRHSADLVALHLPQSAQARGTVFDEVARVLAVSADGRLVASVRHFGSPGALHLTRRDGADRQFRFGPANAAAPVGAAFSPDGSWLAVVTGSGQLWRLDIASGRTSVISPGSDGMVFGISIAFAEDGRILAMQVASVDVPLPSRLAAIDPESGELEVLSGQTSVYQPTPLADGSILFFATRNDGTTEVRQLRDGTESVVAALGATAWVDASRDGRHVAVERSGGRVALVDLATGTSAEIAHGARPKFSPAGDRISVLDPSAGVTRALDLAGNEVARVNSPVVAWAECPEGCDS